MASSIVREDHTRALRALTSLHGNPDDVWSRLRPYRVQRSYSYRQDAGKDFWYLFEDVEVLSSGKTLEKPSQSPAGATLELAVVNIPLPTKHCPEQLRRDPALLTQVFKKFSLSHAALDVFLRGRCAYNHYARTTSSNVDQYFLCLQEICVSWSFNPIASETRAIIMLAGGGWSGDLENRLPQLLNDISSTFTTGFAPGFLGMITGLHRCARDLQKFIEQSPSNKEEILALTNDRNGHDYGKFSASQSWYATRAAKCRQRLIVMDHCLRSHRAAFGTDQSHVSDAQRSLCANLLEHLELSNQSLKAQADRQSEQCSILLSTIWNLIAQEDQARSIRLAQEASRLTFESAEIARASKIIGEETVIIGREAKLDSAAMKSIAFVTMLFLPGTFLASAFSMPLFDWTALSASRVVSPRIWIYFVVTLVLTATTMVGYWFWFRRKNNPDRSSDDDVRSSRQKTMES